MLDKYKNTNTQLNRQQLQQVTGGLTKHPGIIIVECIPPDPNYIPNESDTPSPPCHIPQGVPIF